MQRNAKHIAFLNNKKKKNFFKLLSYTAVDSYIKNIIFFNFYMILLKKKELINQLETNSIFLLINFCLKIS